MPWSAGQVLLGLSRIILHPEESCADLRKVYQLDYLPLAETPADVGMPYDEVMLPVAEGIRLRTWCLPAEADRGTVVVSCGNSGPMACYLFTASLLTQQGWSVVMYDYEGFGGSEGEPTLEALRRDLEAVVEWAAEWASRERVTLMGLSLGSIPTVAVAVERPELVNGVVLDSPIALRAEIERFRFVVLGRSDWILDRLDPALLPDALIGEMQAPLLIYLHERDAVATPETVELLYDLAPGPKELVRFAELGHSRGQFFDTGEYVSHLESFLTSVWSEEGFDWDPSAVLEEEEGR